MCNGKYKIPALAVDAIIREKEKIVLIKRGKEPFKGRWALPGGFVKEGEKTTQAISREVEEETNLKIEIKNLVGVYSDPNRDPRGHVVSVVYSSEIKEGGLEASSDAKETRLFSINELPTLAFDHKKIIDEYKKVTIK
ncbi:hypothetical protein C9439_04745 [archaeon SCG-AAA382B04]|nr:hypothetical protein C9439_04745 [archaeon SCG-AAA382B04]